MQHPGSSNTPVPPDRANQRRSHIVFKTGVLAMLVVITLAVYSPLRKAEFINYDDPDYVTDNTEVKRGLTWSGVGWAFTTSHAGNWHPLTWLAHMSDAEFLGMRAGGHHVVNVLHHAANATLLFWVLNLMTDRFWRSALVAAFFAWHPLHVESVAWVSERKDVLSTLFALLSVWAYVKWVRTSLPRVFPGGSRESARGNAGGIVNRSSSRYYVLLLVFFALALLAKPMVVTLPFLLLLLDFWPLDRIGPAINVFNASSWKRLILEKIPLFLMSAAVSLVTYLVQKRSGAVSPTDLLPMLPRLVNAAVSYLRYAQKTLWPEGLGVFYPHPGAWPLALVLTAVGFLVLMTSVAMVLWRRCPYWLVGWFWYLGTLVPVIGLVQVGDQAMADRYMYLPSVGLFLLIIWSFADLWPRRERILQPGSSLVCVALGACLLITSRQVGYWKNSLTLFSHTAEVAPNNFLALNNVGFYLSEQRDWTGAKRYLEQSLQVKDSAEAWNNLGNVSLHEGKSEEAIGYYRKARALRPQDAQPQNNLANALTQQGRLEEALVCVQEALRLRPDMPQAHYNLGNILALRSNYQGATEAYQHALSFRPDFAQAQYNLGIVLRRLGRREEAERHLKEAARLNFELSNGADSFRNLTNSLAQ